MDHVLNLLSSSYFPGHSKDVQVDAINAVTNALKSAPVGSLGVLLQIAVEPTTETGVEIPAEIRFVAVSRIKNYFKFDMEDDTGAILREDPNFIPFRDLLLQSVLKFSGENNNVIRRQLLEAVRVLIPETKWNYYDGLAPQLRAAAALTSETAPANVDSIANTLTLVELAVALTRNFRFNFTASVCNAISRDLLEVLPPLLTLWRTLGTPQLSPNNLHMIHQIIKVFEDCNDVLVDNSRAHKPQNSNRSNNANSKSSEDHDATRIAADANLGGLIVNWMEYMVGYPQEFLGAFMAATGNDVSKVVGNSRGYLSFVRTVKRIGLIAFGMSEDANRNPPQSGKVIKAKEAKITTKGNRKTFHAPVAGSVELDTSSWITQQCWVAGTLPTRFAQVWLQWLQWVTQQANKPELDAELDVKAAQRKASIQAIRYIKMGITSQALYTEIIMPNFMEIITLLLGALYYNEEDDAMYQDSASDLQDFCIMLEEDAYVMNEFTLRQASSNCIAAFAVATKPYHDSNSIMRILEALNSALAAGVDSATGQELSGNPYLTFGYLHLLGHLKAQIRKRQEIWNGPVEQALLTHVVPRLQSSHIFVKIKALQVCTRYARVPFTNGNLGNFIGAIATMVKDDDARVRLAAIDAMCAFLALAAARPHLKLVLRSLVDECLSLMERVRCAFIPSCLQYLCEGYGVELLPVIGRLTHGISQQLCAALFEVKAEIDAEVVDESEKAQQQSEQNGISIIANCDALYHLVTACDHNPQLLASIVPDVLRPFQLLFTTPDLYTFLEKATDTLMHLIYLTNPVTQELWDFFPHIYNVVMNHGEGIDCFLELANCIDNYLSNSPVAFITNPEAMRMTLEMSKKILIDVPLSDSEREKVGAVQVLGGMFHQGKTTCPDAVAAYVPDILGLVMQALQAKGNAKSTKVKIALVSTILDAYWFNPILAAQVLENAGATVFVFQTVASTFPQLVPVMSTLRRKQFILGLTSFLQLFAATAPEAGGGAAAMPSLAALPQDSQTQIVSGLINIVVACIVANTKNYSIRCKRLEQGLAEEGFEDIAEFEDGDLDLDEFDEDDEEEDDDDIDDNCEDIDYSSPLDDICEVQFFLGLTNVANQGVLSLITAGTMDDITTAAQVSNNLIGLCKQMEAKEKAIHTARSAELH